MNSLSRRLDPVFDALASMRLTLFCLGLMMVLVFVGTIAQVDMGTFAAQRKYFNHFLVYGPAIGGVRIPILPGGLLVGGLWLINLLAVLVLRFRYRLENTGLWLAHAGLIVLVAGQGLTQLIAHENRLVFEEGETRGYIESVRDMELAVTMTSDPDKDFVVSIPASILKQGGRITTPDLPFSVDVKKFFPNAEMAMNTAGNPTPVTNGVGTKVTVVEIPVTTSDDAMNNVSVIAEIMEGPKSLGTWLFSLNLGAPQSVFSNGKEYHFAIRPQRHYLPFQLVLKKFTHDIYPGTDIPKNFASHVRLVYPEKKEDRDFLIYMNHPLRYGGFTFYQASFGKNDTLSILQVVRNPAWLAPYIACSMVLLGLAIQFLTHLLGFLKERR